MLGIYLLSIKMLKVTNFFVLFTTHGENELKFKLLVSINVDMNVLNVFVKVTFIWLKMLQSYALGNNFVLDFKEFFLKYLFFI